MTCITKTIHVASPDGDDLEIEIECDIEWNPELQEACRMCKGGRF